MRAQERIEQALGDLRKAMADVVRDQQTTDQLTGLRNNVALAEILQGALDENVPFWCAMIEVDYFKRVNDKFGHATADLLLKKIGARLKMAEDYVSPVSPIRAHGDEFFLVAASEDDPTEALERVRNEIAGIRIKTEASEPMSCTVSIGWARSTDAAAGVVVTVSEVLRMIEAAVGEAKLRGRNCVVRHDATIPPKLRNSVRDDCAKCRASFTVEIPVDEQSTDHLFCPNCGHRMPRS